MSINHLVSQVPFIIPPAQIQNIVSSNCFGNEKMLGLTAMDWKIMNRKISG